MAEIDSLTLKTLDKEQEYSMTNNKKVAASFPDFSVSGGHLGKNSVLTHLWFSDFGKVSHCSSGHPVVLKTVQRPFVRICFGSDGISARLSVPQNLDEDYKYA